MESHAESPACERRHAASLRPAAEMAGGQTVRHVRWNGLTLGLVASMAAGMAAACGEWIDFLLHRARIRRAMAAVLAGCTACGRAERAARRVLPGAVFLALLGCGATGDHFARSAASMGQTAGELVAGGATFSATVADAGEILDGPSLDLAPLLFSLEEMGYMTGAGGGVLMAGTELWTPAGPGAWWSIKEVIIP